MTAEEEARLSDAAYLKVWTDAGIPHPPISASMDRRKKQFFMYIFDCLGNAGDYLFALRNLGMTDAVLDLSSKGANIHRRDVEDKTGIFGNAVTALEGSQAWRASPEGQKSKTIRDITECIQYTLCKAVIQKVIDISLETNPNRDNQNDNGAGFGNVVADMLSINTGHEKAARSEILAELIYIQVANIILRSISAQYAGGISGLEDQIRIMYGAATLQEYKKIVTADNAQAYVNRVWLYALLIFLDQDPTNERARQMTNSPTSWFGFSALAAVVFKYRDIEILPHQIDMAISGAQQITTLDSLAQFCTRTIRDADGYTVDQMDHLFEFNGFPRDNRPVTLATLDESVQLVSDEIKSNAASLRANGEEMQTGRDAAARSYEKYVAQGLGVQSGVQRNLEVRPSSLYIGQYFDPDRRNISRDNSQASVNNSQNSLDANSRFEPYGNFAAPPGTFPTRDFLERTGYTGSIPPPTAAFVEQQQKTGYGRSPKGLGEYTQEQGQKESASSSRLPQYPHARPYSSSGDRTTITSVHGLSGNRNMNSNSNSSSSSSGNSMSDESDEDTKGGRRRRKTRKIKKHKKTKKAKKSKKSKKSRKSRK
jgi:hypothetical protein